LERIEK
jgi:hypothetical protein